MPQTTATAQSWIDALQLNPHPEGGYYKELPHSSEKIRLADGRERFHYTSIYFLLTDKSPSHFHRLKSDEIWYFHAGAPLTVHCLHADGSYGQIRLGLDAANGEAPQALIAAGTIFGSTVEAAGGGASGVARDGDGAFALVNCMVSPGFDFRDFELFTQDELLATHAAHAGIIRRLALAKRTA